MTISMDKKYRTRDGRDVRLLCVDGPKHAPVIGTIGEVLGQWTSSGTFDFFRRSTDLDLIEYHDPDIRTIWVNVYEDGGVAAYKEDFSAKQAYDNNPRPFVTIARPVTFEVKK